MTQQQNGQTEFYGPFAHVPGRYEFCRIHSQSHGSFDCFILIETRTDETVTVYVDSENGEAFMTDRYPESRVFRARPGRLEISVDRDGLMVAGTLESADGPVREVNLVFRRIGTEELREVPYGGPDFRVWGSRWSCTGTDMEADAQVSGRIVQAGGVETLDAEAAVITLGSCGTIRPIGR